MRIGIAGTQTTELVAKSIKETLSDAGFESLLIIAGLLIMGGAASSIAADSGEDLGYPPDYPGVP